MFHDHAMSNGYSTWNAVFRLNCEFYGKVGEYTEIYDSFQCVKGFYIHRALTEDESHRLVVEQENTGHKDRKGDEHAIIVVSNRLMGRRGEQVDRHKAAKNLDQNSKNDWKGELKIPEEYSTYRHKFIQMLIQYKCTSVHHFGSTKAVQHQIKLDKADREPVQSASCRARANAREFERKEIDRMVAMDIFKPASGMGITDCDRPEETWHSPLLC